MQTCGPRAKARCWRAFSRPHVEAVGIGERRRVAVGGRDRDADELAAADRRAAQRHVRGRVPVDHGRRRLEPQRLLDGVGQPARGRPSRARAASRSREQVQDRVGDHPLGRLDAAEEHHRGVGDDLAPPEPARMAAGGGEQRRAGLAIEHRLDGGPQLGERRPAGVGNLAAGRDLGHRRDDRVVPAQDGAGVGLAQARASASRWRRRAGRRRHAAAPPRPRARWRRSGGRPRRRRPSVKRSRTACRRNGPRERRAVALVLVAVEREHARADDAPGREARVVDRERGRVAHDLQREIAAQDEPAARAGSHDTGARSRRRASSA